MQRLSRKSQERVSLNSGEVAEDKTRKLIVKKLIEYDDAKKNKRKLEYASRKNSLK